MRIPRIHTTAELDNHTRLELDERAARYLVQVLRLRTDDALVLFNGDGRDYPARVVRATRRSVEVQTGERTDLEVSPPLSLHLVLGVSKGERMDFAIQKAVELGVASISPVFTRRSVVNLRDARLERREAHWRGVGIAATEQSGRRRIPPIRSAVTLEQWCAAGPYTGVCLDPRAARGLDSLAPPRGDFHIAIGPEGGLEPGERESLQDSGLQGVTLGPRILRTETAPLAAIAAMQILWGDFRTPA